MASFILASCMHQTSLTTHLCGKFYQIHFTDGLAVILKCNCATQNKLQSQEHNATVLTSSTCSMDKTIVNCAQNILLI